MVSGVAMHKVRKSKPKNLNSVKKSAPKNTDSVKKSAPKNTDCVKKSAPKNTDGVKKSSKHLKDGVCPYAKKCGGCDYQWMEYAKQLKEKQEYVKKQVGAYCKVLPIIGMEQPYHYRNKVHAVFGLDRFKKPVSGIYEEGTHRIVPVDSCLIENEKADANLGWL